MKYTNYTNKEYNNISSTKIIIPLTEEDSVRFIFLSFLESSNKKIYLSKVCDNIANIIMKEYGIRVTNYNISLRSYTIRKIMKSHGDMIDEILRGQQNITIDDFLMIGNIVNQPDSIVLSNKKTNEGKSVLLFKKTIDSTLCVVVNISDKHHSLEIQTMYKKRTLPL